MSLTLPWLKSGPTTVGFSGHWAKEEYDNSISQTDEDIDSWSVNLDLTQPVNSWLKIKAELFSGENLNTYFGGIGQGVNISTFREIGSRGGWLAAGLGPWGKWSFNVGAGMDDVDAGDLDTTDATADRTMNRAIFGNVMYSVNKNTQLGLELSHWRTDYKGPGDADSVRAQTSLIYKF